MSRKSVAVAVGTIAIVSILTTAAGADTGTYSPAEDWNSYNVAMNICDSFLDKTCKPVGVGAKTCWQEQSCQQVWDVSHWDVTCLKPETICEYSQYKSVCSKSIPKECSWDDDHLRLKPKQPKPKGQGHYQSSRTSNLYCPGYADLMGCGDPPHVNGCTPCRHWDLSQGK